MITQIKKDLLVSKTNNFKYINLKGVNKKDLYYLSTKNRYFIKIIDLDKHIYFNTTNNNNIILDMGYRIPYMGENTPEIGGRRHKSLLYGDKMFLIYLYLGLPDMSLKRLLKIEDIGTIIKSGGSQWMQ